MRLVTFRKTTEEDDAARLGVMRSDNTTLVDLQVASTTLHERPPWLTDMVGLLQAGNEAMDTVSAWLERAEKDPFPGMVQPISALKLLAPVPQPNSIRDCLSFERHLLQAMRTVARWRFPPLAWLDERCERLLGKGLFRVPRIWHAQPIYYKGNPRSVVGTDEDVIWPSYTERLDFELELGVFLRRAGRDIPERDADDYIGGFTLFNDFSARDVQVAEMSGRMGPSKGKDFDTGNALGPYLVTPDEIRDVLDMKMSASVNGQVWTTTDTSTMHFSLAEIIAFVSRDETLFPGDFIGLGTLPSGCGLELDRWIKPGDTVELRSDELGVLRNRVCGRSATR